MNGKAWLMAAMVVSLADGGAGLRDGTVKAAGGAQTLSDREEQVEARDLVQRLERAVQSGDLAGYLALVSPSADPIGAAAFAREERKAGASRVVIQERELSRITRA